MTDIRIVKEYPYAPDKVWRALTEPELIARWMMRPEGFAPKAGTRFRLVAKPQPGWRGYVDCEVIEATKPTSLAYTWVGDEDGKPTTVRYTLEATAGGTRLTFVHSGFVGFGGFVLAKLMLGPGWKKMLGATVPRLLSALRDDGSFSEQLPARYGEPRAAVGA
jgi:uncharacterized protein YndB with AHSA1/START domain